MFETIFIIAVMLLLAFSMRVVPEQQRIAVIRLGRYAGLKGPGMVMVVPYMDRECKISIGDQGELTGDQTGNFHGIQVPVIADANRLPGASIRVVGFTRDRVQVV